MNIRGELLRPPYCCCYKLILPSVLVSWPSLPYKIKLNTKLELSEYKSQKIVYFTKFLNFDTFLHNWFSLETS